MSEHRGVLALSPQRESQYRRVAYCVASGEVRHTVGIALRTGHFEPVEIRASDILPALRRNSPCAALVHDLQPWDTTGPARISQVRQEHPDLPIVLYPPARAGIADLLIPCVRLHGIRAELQQTCTTREVERLRRLVVSAIEEAPRVRLLRMLQTVVPQTSVRIWSFAELALESVGRQDRTSRLTVGRLAGRLGISQRTLERSWHSAALPRPKELLEWLGLLLAALLSAESGLTVARAARKLGMDSQQLYRFRQRLLPPVLRSARESFDTLFLAFTSRCLRDGRPVPCRAPSREILEA